ncbi:MAG: recombinase family protein, partial [Planctomycetaceae bacterium]|nr:recombinase family protein [Planctomycetaceae bacterium]
MYEEKVTGARRTRPQLARMLDQLRAGDVVVVSRL